MQSKLRRGDIVWFDPPVWWINEQHLGYSRGGNALGPRTDLPTPNAIGIVRRVNATSAIVIFPPGTEERWINVDWLASTGERYEDN